MSVRTHQLKKILVTPTMILVIAAMLYGSTYIDETSVARITQWAGPMGPLIIALFILATMIFAPLSGAPGIFVAIKLYGYPAAMLMFYAVSLVSATSNFYISRTFGRKLVLKLVGTKAMRDVDSLSSSDELSLLIVGRLFGYYFFDIISYAAGFTRIPFKKYMAYTAILTLAPFGAQYFLFRHLDYNTVTGIAIYYGSLLLTGGLFTAAFYRIHSRRKRQDMPEARAEDVA